MFHLEDKDKFIKPLPHDRKKSIGMRVYYTFFNPRHCDPRHPDYFLDDDADYMAYLAQCGKVGSKKQVKSLIEQEFNYTSAKLTNFIFSPNTLILESTINGQRCVDTLIPADKDQPANASLQVFPADGPFALIKVARPKDLYSAETMLANCTDMQKIHSSPEICQSLLQYVMDYKAAKN